MTRKKRPKVVWVGSTRVTPWTAEEHRRIERRIRKRDEKLRRRYREIHGKKVDWVSRSIEDGCLYFTVRFTDTLLQVPNHGHFLEGKIPKNSVMPYCKLRDRRTCFLK